MERNTIDIDLNQFGLPAVEGIRLIPLHAFGINQMTINREWSPCHFSQSCIVLKPSKYYTAQADNQTSISLTINADLKLNINDFKIELLRDNFRKANSIRA